MAMRGTLVAAKRVVPHLIAYKVSITIADAVKKRKRVDIDTEHSQFKLANRRIWYCIGLKR